MGITKGHPVTEGIDVAKRRQKGADLRRAGHTWQYIADALGYSDRGAACKDLTRAYEAAVAEMNESLDALRQVELGRLDAELDRLEGVYAEAESIMRRHHITVSQGRIVTDADGETVPDYGPALAAMGMMIKVEDARRRNGERRAKLLGLDAAVKVDARVTDATMAEVQDLMAQMENLDAQEEQQNQARERG